MGSTQSTWEIELCDSQLSMARNIICLALLACLGFTFLQLASGEQLDSELEDAQLRTVREAKRGPCNINGRRPDGTRCKRTRNIKSRRCGNNKVWNKKTKECMPKKRTNGKKGRPCRKLRKKQKKQAMQKIKVKSGKQACNVEALCQQIKNYIKYSNQLRKLKRINKTCSTMDKKGAKAGEGEFTASGEANADSGSDNVTVVADKLKNCSATAKEKCETKAIPACLNPNNTICEAALDAWIKKFGPAQGSCLQSSADCCACITGISPAPPAECLSFDDADKTSKAKKKICTGSDTEGSFGHCRKLQIQASVDGPV